MKKPTVIMIANQKGGVGKTQCAVELCTVLGKKGYKVLGLDYDPQSSFSVLSKADTKAMITMKEVMDVKVRPMQGIQKLDNYDIIVGSQLLSDADTTYGKTEDAWLIQEIVEDLKETTDYDFIIMDSAPGRSKLLDMEYIAADYLIAPVDADGEATKGLYMIQSDIAKLSKHGQSHVKILGVFMNKKQHSNIDDGFYENFAQVAEQIGTQRFNTTIRHTVKVKEARLNFTSISEYAEHNSDAKGVAEDYENLANEIIERLEA